MPSFSYSFPILHRSFQISIYGFIWHPCDSFHSFPISLCAPVYQTCSINPHSVPIPVPCSKPFVIVAMPVCPRSVSCHPMGSMSFKTLQAQPIPHCRSHERSFSREMASSSSKSVRRRTVGSTQVGHVIEQNFVGLNL